MFSKKFFLASAAVASLGLTGCVSNSGSNIPDNDPVKIVDKATVGPFKSYTMSAGQNGMEYQPNYSSKTYQATVQWRGGTYDVPVTEKCFNSLTPGSNTSVGQLKNECGDSMPSLIRPVR